MQKLLKLFSILQLTKEQPVSGYLVSGIKSFEMPTLAEHHYTMIVMGYFLAEKIKQAGGKINERKLILMLMIHDLSELFGGDVAGPLNRKYPDLREHKDKIGERAFEMLAEFMDNATGKAIKGLFLEFEAGASDEAMVAKIIDQIDHQFFLEHNNYKQKYRPGEADYRPDFVSNYIYNLPKNIKDAVTKRIMTEFLEEFDKNYFGKGYQAISFLMDSDNSN